MARYMRLDVINTLLETGVLPLFYNGDLEIAIELVKACARGGARTSSSGPVSTTKSHV